MTSRRLLVSAWLGLLGCVAPMGGWDSAALLARFPEIEAIPGQRLGDLTPYPALVDGRVAMVACRFERPEPSIPVVISGEDWPSSWGASALDAVDAAVPAVSFERQGGAPVSPGIHIRSMSAAGGAGPAGLADTRAECDVAASDGAGTEIRGTLVRSEIRIRRRVLGTWTRERAATAEDWVGAMLHELGHALGFQGHAAVGASLVQLEQSRLRALGRRVLEGAPVAAPNVRALYALAPGTRLGVARLSPSSRSIVAEVVDELAERTRVYGPPVASRSVVGDRHARLVWRWQEGGAIVLQFPSWSESLRWGREVEVRRSDVGSR